MFNVSVKLTAGTDEGVGPVREAPTVRLVSQVGRLLQAPPVLVEERISESPALCVAVAVPGATTGPIAPATVPCTVAVCPTPRKVRTFLSAGSEMPATLRPANREAPLPGVAPAKQAG